MLWSFVLLRVDLIAELSCGAGWGEGFTECKTSDAWGLVRTSCRAHASLLHQGSQLLSGKNKWLGGVLGLDDNIYCIRSSIHGRNEPKQ